jgi:signal recognition particle receptor subunit beta
VDVRPIVSILSGLFSVTGLSLARRKIAHVMERIRPQYSIQIVGPPAAGKTTLFRYLRHEPLVQEPPGRMSRRRVGRIAADLSGITTYFVLSTISDEPSHESTTARTWWLKHDHPDGLILIIDTHDPEAEHAYFERLYEAYRACSTQTQPDKLRVLLILLNKFDLWGCTAEAREAMINHYRGKIFQDLVNRFRSRFGTTVQWGYASLTQPEHAPYNNVILNEFLMVLAQKGSAVG